jgi:GT2 family glycosyltransferase
LLSVVIVNWNAGAMLHDCVTSVYQHMPHDGEVGDVTVVDNASSDGSAKDLTCCEQKGLTVIENSENLGFGKACNVGAANARSEFLLFLNPDAVVLPETLEGSLAFMQAPSNADIGICGVQLIDESGHVARSCARFPSPVSFAAQALGLDRIYPRLGSFMADWAHDTTREVDQVIGAFFLVRRQVFEALGGFDERFFVYFEDLDFSCRAKRAGWRSMYLADVQAFHAGGGISKQVKARRLFYSLRSRLLYSFKHFSFVGAMAVLLTTLLLEPLSRSALAFAGRSQSSFQETWAGYGMLWRWLPQWIFKGVTR